MQKTDEAQKPFQILALSGGGFRGLYTAQIIAAIEKSTGKPFGSHFDLITGTSIGGILALALAREIPAKKIVDLFINDGAKIFKRRWSMCGFVRAPYSPAPLQKLLSDSSLFGESLLGASKHPVMVPSMNYSTGEPVVFKTPHHKSLEIDHSHRIVDIAMATSAAPAYFPRHCFNNCQYVDGGIYANAPGLLGLHEAIHFFGQSAENIRLLAIGTMSSRFTVDPQQHRGGGVRDWGQWSLIAMPRRLFGLAMVGQEVLTDSMLKHNLGDRYCHIDTEPTEPRARAVALDKTDDSAREVLLAAAAEDSKACLGDQNFRKFVSYSAAMPRFYYGENAN